MIDHAITKLVSGLDLSSYEVSKVLADIFNNQEGYQIKTAKFLELLALKGESKREIISVIKYLIDNMIEIKPTSDVLDIVGTGGDGFNTVNISTGSALLAAACGVKVAKHGNRSASSLCGSADYLEAAGVSINNNATEIKSLIDEVNIGFCFAPKFHPELSKLKSIRKKLGIRTIFNYVGPLINPANAQYKMIGVARKQDMQLFADILISMSIKHAIVFNCTGLDEICTVGTIDIIEIINNTQKKFTLNPINYGFKLCDINDIQGGLPEVNADLINDALKGQVGPISDSLILNAGFACFLYGVSKNLSDGIELARAVHKIGGGYDTLKKLISNSNSLLRKREEIDNV